MTTTAWVNTSTGERLSPERLLACQQQARRLYAVNPHIFEDEADALCALGVVIP